MLQVILAAIVVIWFFRAAEKADLHQGKWVFAGLTAFLVPSILWAAFFVFFLRKPLLESSLRHYDGDIMSIAIFLAAAIGSLLGLVGSYVLNRKYLTEETRDSALAFERGFKAKAVYLVALILLSALIALFAAMHAPEVHLESQFNYKLF